MTKRASGYPLRYVGFYSWAAALTCLMGMVMHACNWLYGSEVFMHTLGTPQVDFFLVLMMAYSAVGMVMFYPMVDFRAPWRKYVYWFLAVYFWISIPVHFQVQMTQSTELITAFPSWYSPVLLPILGLMVAYFVLMRFHPPIGYSHR